VKEEDRARQEREIERVSDILCRRLAGHTRRPVDTVRADMERSLSMDAEQARVYGIVDAVIGRPESTMRPGRGTRDEESE